MITKSCKTSDTRHISSTKLKTMRQKSQKIITISGTKVREGGRTVGSGRVATIIE